MHSIRAIKRPPPPAKYFRHKPIYNFSSVFSFGSDPAVLEVVAQGSLLAVPREPRTMLGIEPETPPRKQYVLEATELPRWPNFLTF